MLARVLAAFALLVASGAARADTYLYVFTVDPILTTDGFESFTYTAPELLNGENCTGCGVDLFGPSHPGPTAVFALFEPAGGYVEEERYFGGDFPYFTDVIAYFPGGYPSPGHYLSDPAYGSSTLDIIDISTPEPSSFLLVGTALLLALGSVRWSTRQMSAAGHFL